MGFRWIIGLMLLTTGFGVMAGFRLGFGFQVRLGSGVCYLILSIGCLCVTQNRWTAWAVPASFSVIQKSP